MRKPENLDAIGAREQAYSVWLSAETHNGRTLRDRPFVGTKSSGA